MPLPLQVVNVDSVFRKTTGYQWLEERIRAAGGELILCHAITEDQLMATCARADIVVVEHPNTPVNARVIGAMTRSLAIVKCAVGLDNIDVETASGHGIVVCSIADYCTEEVSDHTVGLLLCAVRRISSMDRYIRGGGWDEPEPLPIVRRFRNLTLGIIGLGRIGSAVARKLRGFEMRILATDPYLDRSSEPGVQLVPLERLLRESDLVTLHVPLTVETRNLIGRAALACMKPSAILANTSRGPVIDEEALIAALREGRIAGAALDVTVQEPLPQASPLRSFPNIILTPHGASHSEDARAHWKATVVDSVEALVRRYWPPFPANPGIVTRAPLQPWAAFSEIHR
jgi:D-3-phosphoglycerate dehydrogenase